MASDAPFLHRQSTKNGELGLISVFVTGSLKQGTCELAIGTVALRFFSMLLVTRMMQDDVIDMPVCHSAMFMPLEFATGALSQQLGTEQVDKPK